MASAFDLGTPEALAPGAKTAGITGTTQDKLAAFRSHASDDVVKKIREATKLLEPRLHLALVRVGVDGRRGVALQREREAAREVAGQRREADMVLLAAGAWSYAIDGVPPVARLRAAQLAGVKTGKNSDGTRLLRGWTDAPAPNQRSSVSLPPAGGRTAAQRSTTTPPRAARGASRQAN